MQNWLQILFKVTVKANFMGTTVLFSCPGVEGWRARKVLEKNKNTP